MTTAFTTYKSKATAKRGFERQFPGIDPAPYISEVDIGKWGFYPDQVDTTGEAAAELAEQDMPTDLAAPEHQVDAPALVEEGTPHEGHPIPAPPVTSSALEATIADAPSEESAPAAEAPAEVRRKSLDKGAVKHCWEFFNAHPDLKRKEAVAAMVDKGVAFYTARTQYQRWFAARKTAA